MMKFIKLNTVPISYVIATTCIGYLIGYAAIGFIVGVLTVCLANLISVAMRV